MTASGRSPRKRAKHPRPRPTGAARLALRPPAGGPPQRRSFPTKGVLIGLVTFVGVVATAIGSVYAAVYTIAPDLKPREKLGATIDHISVEHGIDYAGYLSEMGDTATVPSPNVS